MTAGARMGRYVLNRLLGVGGMAEVWEATDELLGRTVAVKIILPAIASDPEFAPRFQREGRLAAALEHPHILPVYDFGAEGDSAYIVTRLVPGGNLADRIARPVATSDALDWLTAVADALDYAHARKVIHRDIKPANILFDETGRPYLADFGVAKDLAADSQLTITGTVVGTPNYMAPEQASGQGAVPASDQYALGILAYRLLAERLPFEGLPTPVALYRTIYESVPPPSSFAPQLAADVDKVILRALAKKPANRHPSCLAFMRALRRALEEPETERLPTVEPAPVVPAQQREEADARPPAPSDAALEPAPDVTPAPAEGPPPRARWRLLLLVAVAAAVVGVLAVRGLLRRGEPSPAGPEPTSRVASPTPGAASPASAARGTATPEPPRTSPTEVPTRLPTPVFTALATPVPSPARTRAAARPTAVPRRTPVPPTPVPTPPPAPTPAGPDVAAERTLYVAPVYPKEARSSGAQGTVVIEVTVDTGGRVSVARVVKGVDAALDEAALRAVRQWRYRPAQRYGAAVPATFNVSVVFRLSSSRPGA